MTIKRKYFNNSNGFTLVELLLVVIIIGVLSGVILSVMNVSGLRAKARDAQRIGDLEKIQLALELYFADNRSYPLSANWIEITGTSDPLSTALTSPTVYMNNIPTDPLTGSASINSISPCNDAALHRYNYRTSSTGSLYLLTSIVEISTGDDVSKCIDLKNWSSATCGGGTAVCGCTSGNTWNADPDFCYGVENPL